MRHRLARCFVAIAIVLTGIRAMPNGPRHVSFVPWKVLDHGQAAAPSALTLYWVPASGDEVKRSPMVHSETLAGYSRLCVSMLVIRADDGARLSALSLSAEDLPAALLIDGTGLEIGRAKGERGALRIVAVEALLRDEMERRSLSAESALDRARAHLAAGETDAATALYTEVWEQRCVSPRQGKVAERALKKLRR